MLIENKTIQEKLDALNQIPPEFHFQQQAVWNKLEESLQNKKRPFFMSIWMRYAAAIVFLAISTFTFLKNNPSSNELLKNKLAQKNNIIVLTQNKSQSLLLKQTNTEKKLAKNKVSKNMLPAHSSLKNKQSIIKPSSTLDQRNAEHEYIASVLESPKTMQSTSTEINNAPVLILNNPTTITTNKKPSSKRLPVIHINDIGRVEQPLVTIATNKHANSEDTQEPIIISENNKTWWWPKPKPITPPIITLTDNQ